MTVVYAVYIRSSAWERKKRKYRASRLPQTCRVCGAKGVDLHHLTYKRLGRERLTDLAPLCRRHHDGAHAFAKRKNIALWQATHKYIRAERKKLGLRVPK